MRKVSKMLGLTLNKQREDTLIIVTYNQLL